MGSTPVGGSEKSFSEYFDLRTLLRYLVEYCIKNLDKPTKNSQFPLLKQCFLVLIQTKSIMRICPHETVNWAKKLVLTGEVNVLRSDAL